MKNIYKIHEGKITELNKHDLDLLVKEGKNCNWTDTAIIHADDEEEAKLLSQLYDKRVIEFDGILLDNGKWLVVLQMPDESKKIIKIIDKIRELVSSL